MNDGLTFSTTSSNGGRRRLWLFGSIAFVIVLLLVWWNRRGDEEAAAGTESTEAAETETAEAEAAAAFTLEEETQERIGLETVEVQLRPIGAQVRTTAIIGPNETRVAHLRALSTGVITGVMVRRGDRVTAGQALLTYDNVELGGAVAGYRSALATLETAQGEAEADRLALERADRLVEIGGIAQAEQQRRKAEYAAALAGVRSSQAQVANLRQTLARFGVSERELKDGDADLGTRSTLRAPFSGTVLEVQAVGGETVSPERELVTVADLTTVWILGDVYERDLAAIAEGSEARVATDAYPDEPFSCRVTDIAAVLDPQTRTAKVRCEAKNPNGRLRLQIFARMEILAGAPRQVLTVPSRAIQQIDGEPTLFVRTGDESFERRAVRLGAATEEWTEVTSGVESGDRVVTTGAVMLKSRLQASEFAEEEEEEEP
jgi:cobalt-zinc-cadmium efflux system membrane fusion protein